MVYIYLIVANRIVVSNVLRDLNRLENVINATMLLKEVRKITNRSRF